MLNVCEINVKHKLAIFDRVPPLAPDILLFAVRFQKKI